MVIDEVEDERVEEWLANARSSLDVGVKKFGIPCYLIFFLFDYLFARDNLLELSLVRFGSIPLALFLTRYVQLAKTKDSFLRRYALLAAGFGALVYFVIYILADPANYFFIGLMLVAMGANSFIIGPFRYYLLNSILIFLPFFAFSPYIAHMDYAEPQYLIFLLMALCLIVIFEYARRNTIRLQEQEFETRMAMNRLLNEREITLRDLASELSNMKLQQSEYLQKEDIFKLARQVAHDILSPLSALNLATQKLTGASDDVADLIKASSHRINQIAETMLVTSRQRLSEQYSKYSANLNRIVDIIVAEKKVLVDSRIRFAVDVKSELPVLRIQEADVARIVSNIIQNSIDAIANEGEIRITARETPADQVTLEIWDNGQGIPADIIKSLGAYGFSYGKKAGSGLGLAFVKNVLESAGGSLKIDSILNKYTRITLTLPTVKELSDQAQ